MYCVGLLVVELLSVTVRLVVLVASLFILNDVIVGLRGSFKVMVSLTTGDSPVAFLTLK